MGQGDPAIDRPLLPALEAVDLFFLSLAFFIMAIGLAQLFADDLPSCSRSPSAGHASRSSSN